LIESIPKDRKDSAVSISILDMKAFNKIKGYLGYYSSKPVSSQEVMAELISTWYRVNQEAMKSESN